MLQQVPECHLHRGSGRAFVQIKGGRIYLGKHGSDESQEHFAHAPASESGPLAFKALRQKLIDAGHSRKYTEHRSLHPPVKPIEDGTTDGELQFLEILA